MTAQVQSTRTPIALLPSHCTPMSWDQWLDSELFDVLEARDALTYEHCRRELADLTERLVIAFVTAPVRLQVLDGFHRQLQTTPAHQLADAIRSGALDVSPVLAAALFPKRLARSTWPANVRAACDYYQDVVDDIAPGWAFVRQAYREYLQDFSGGISHG